MFSQLSSLLLLLATSATSTSIPYGGPRGRPDRQVVTASPVKCRVEYVTLWDTTYQEREEQVCTTLYEKQCHTKYEQLCQATTRQECRTVQEQQCHTVYNSVCVQEYRTQYVPYTETECHTEYKEDCEYQWEGHGNDKAWAPIAGTCKTNPYETCKDVAKTKERQVAYPVCHDVPEEICIDVPKQECVQVPDQVCTNQPLQKCQDVPRQACHNVHKKVPVRVSKRVPKKVCEHGTQQHVPAIPAETFVPSFAGSGPEVIDTGNKDEDIKLQKNQVAASETDNSIVFGD